MHLKLIDEVIFQAAPVMHINQSFYSLGLCLRPTREIDELDVFTGQLSVVAGTRQPEDPVCDKNMQQTRSD
jgi:hypothetical protein